MVFTTYQTILGSASVAFWSGVVFPLCAHRNILREGISDVFPEEDSFCGGIAIHSQSCIQCGVYLFPIRLAE
jgi:hypothetical protein